MVWSSFARRRYNYLRNYVIGSTMQAQVQSGVHEFYSPSDKTGMSTAPSIFSKCSVTSPTSKLVSPLARKVQERQQRGYGIPMDRVSLRPSIFSLFSFRERSAAVISQTTLRDILEIVRKYVQNYSPLSATSPKKKIPPPSKSQLLMLMKEKKEYKVKYLMQAPPSLILDPLCEYILLLGSLANVQITLRLYDLVQLRQIDANLDYKEEVFQTLYLEQDELKRKNLVTFVQILTQNYPKQQLHTTYVRDALFLSYYNSPHSSKRLEIILHEVEQMVDLLKLLDRCPYGQACVKDIHASIAQLQLKEDLSTSSTLPEVNITLKHSNPPAVPGLGDSATVLLPIVEENEEELA
ncbi:hypothetical protein HMI54_008615 [Coelomomyces lativittatus]|nr:hypothetical protein HMI56_006263 [Coelomomyces lativittatus]KAJ1516663.1 hypothetical protein HMI54_008615 [Coelomomyces lativittatus]KAJ1517829.1 hypothetical protein HMI55_005695 [Coelomomyces lativittatus]